MSYTYTSAPQNSVPGKSFASPKTHGPVSRLSNLGHRYYQPEMGRWASRDPIGEWGGVNLYGFVGNKPVGWVDYLGLSIGDDHHGNYGGRNRVNGILRPNGQEGLSPEEIGPPNGPNPIDWEDECYLDHDRCVAGLGKTCGNEKGIVNCDSRLQACLATAPFKKPKPYHKQKASILHSLGTIPVFSIAHSTERLGIGNNGVGTFTLFKINF